MVGCARDGSAPTCIAHCQHVPRGTPGSNYSTNTVSGFDTLCDMRYRVDLQSLSKCRHRRLRLLHSITGTGACLQVILPFKPNSAPYLKGDASDASGCVLLSAHLSLALSSSAAPSSQTTTHPPGSRPCPLHHQILIFVGKVGDMLMVYTNCSVGSHHRTLNAGHTPPYP